jgi:hypothetical protein
MATSIQGDSIAAVQANEPFLVKFSVAREGDASIPGRYCPDLSVWVVDTPSGARPLVEVCRDNLEDVTKTMTVREEDDDVRLALEVTTKTARAPEGDDDRFGHALLELSTKTETRPERDD